MKKILSLAAAFAAALTLSAQDLPREIYSGSWNSGHVQGAVVDAAREYVYFSFTDMIVKTDMNGKVVGTVTGLLGHLGCLDYNEEDGLIYGSLEYKDDVIGQGILKRNKSDLQYENTFYIAIIDGKKIVRENMDALKDGIVTCVNLPSVVADYEDHVTVDGKELPHRLGCSGIDGVSFGPEFGKKGGKNYLMVCYGIYGDNDRSDNDYQVILEYDTSKWMKKYAKPLEVGNLHRQGPAKPRKCFYAFTGNTTWGIQNLEYDPNTGYWFMAAYKGKKPQYPNYTLFAVDGASKPVKQKLEGVPYVRKGLVVPLADAGKKHKESGVRGWRFKYGATGIISMGNGLFYFSENSKTPEKLQQTTLRLYRYTGDPDAPFTPVE